jgi:hypothetical protein
MSGHMQLEAQEGFFQTQATRPLEVFVLLFPCEFQSPPQELGNNQFA